MNKNSLGLRMKEYEKVSRNYLIRRTPVIIRIDGRSFKTFTKGLRKPFDDILIESMWQTAKELCEGIQGCKMAYIQSDEISLLLTDYDNLDSHAWFDNNVQKMTSISASMATLAFNKAFSKLAGHYIYCLENYNSTEDEEYLFNKYGIKTFVNEYDEVCVPDEYLKLKEVYNKRMMTAMFDARVFNIPKEEVNNYFVYRQKDAIRNSIQMVAQVNFSHKKLEGLNCNELKEKLLIEKGLNWDDLSIPKQRGACIIKENYELDNEEKTIRSRWIVNENIPLFSSDKNFIKNLTLPLK